jgi:uncharacterized metal-binding protein YceD (DUF177 family)
VVKYLKQYIIPIAGQETGSRQYDFKIDGLFFEQYPESEIDDCSVSLHLEVVKQEDLFILNFEFTGDVGLVCDRCLDPFRLKVDGSDTLTLKMGGKGSRKDDDEVISAEAQEISVRQYIYDFIMLRIPIRRTHPEDDPGNSSCDQEVLKKIEELSNKKDTDSPWDKLKDLQNN